MAHPPDQALTRAITEVLHQARSRGMTTRDLAGYFGVSDATISRWEAGGRQPALDLLPTFDRLAGRERGYTLRLAGYVNDPEQFTVNKDDPVEVAIWDRAKTPRAHRQRMIEEYRQMDETPPPRKRQARPVRRRSA